MTSIQRARRTIAAAAAMGMIAACDPSDDEEPRSVEIFSWWTSPGEAEALQALLDVHKQAHPNTEVVNAAADDFENAQERLTQRFAEGFPPDTFQTNGSNVQGWVEYNGADASESKIEPIADLYAELGLAAAIPQPVIDAMSYDGTPYAIPVNIHRNNSLFYNTAILEEHGITPPGTLDELWAACDTLAAADIPCFSFGAGDGWPAKLLVFENLLVATAGTQYTLDFLYGRRDPADPEVGEVADIFLQFYSYAHPSSLEDSWEVATLRVGKGEAAMTVMGDWAKATLRQAGYEPGVDFGQAPFPGTVGTFVFVSDCFPLPLGAKARNGAIDLLETMASIEGQTAFNVIKGSIPARTDISADPFDPLGQAMIADFHDADSYMLAESDRYGIFTPYLIDTLESGDRDLFINAVRDTYDATK